MKSTNNGYNASYPANLGLFQMQNHSASNSEVIPFRVLIMDDEEMLRDVLSLSLTQMGYQPDACEDGQQALDLYRQALLEDHRPYRVVILDLTIRGGMGGMEAAELILELDSQATIVVSSGYSNDPVMTEPARFGFKGVLSKPFTLTELDHLITRVAR